MRSRAIWLILSCVVLACPCCEPDSDGDGEPDATDQCPHDPDKTSPGKCGCGVPEGSCDDTTEDYVTCPNQVPSEGDDCSDYADGQLLLTCSWGDHPRYVCRTTAACYKVNPNGEWQWHVTVPSEEKCGDLLPTGCPDEHPNEQDPCDQEELFCHYDQGKYCLCTRSDPYPCYPVCGWLEDPVWQCITPPQQEGCPRVPPNAGTECTLSDGSTCWYTCEHIMTCQEGVWIYQGDNCPICAAPDTPIATPDGERLMSDLRVGDLVYSVEENQTIVVPLLRVSRTRVFDHFTVQVSLKNGSVLLISAGHPTADGRAFSDLVAGETLGDQKIRDVTIVPYPFEYTYDILPDSTTGFYFAAGALIGSTLSTDLVFMAKKD